MRDPDPVQLHPDPPSCLDLSRNDIDFYITRIIIIGRIWILFFSRSDLYPVFLDGRIRFLLKVGSGFVFSRSDPDPVFYLCLDPVFS